MTQQVKHQPDKDRQSLVNRTRDTRHELLQLFADVEIALTGLLRDEKYKTFGQKLQEAAKRFEKLKPHASLNDLRNLIAHAKFEVASVDGACVVIMRVSGSKAELNARVISSDQWTASDQAWRGSVRAILHDLRAISTAPQAL